MRVYVEQALLRVSFSRQVLEKCQAFSICEMIPAVSEAAEKMMNPPDWKIVRISVAVAMYAVAPHLIELSRTATPEMSLHLLTHAGLIYAESPSPRSVSCPKFLANEFQAIAPDAADRLARLLPTIQLRRLQIRRRRTGRFRRAPRLRSVDF
jgi:hypothetical protein